MRLRGETKNADAEAYADRLRDSHDRSQFAQYSNLSIVSSMNTLQELQQWYRSNCDGNWEHRYGVKIDTLDNPGWSVTIELGGTDVADRPFTEVEQLAHETDWMDCRVRNQTFRGQGGPFMLEEILRVFLEWAMDAH